MVVRKWTDMSVYVQNGMAYPCFCTSRRLDLLRREAVSRGEVPRYDNRCRHMSQSDAQAKTESGVPHVVRFKVYLLTHGLFHNYKNEYVNGIEAQNHEKDR